MRGIRFFETSFSRRAVRSGVAWFMAFALALPAAAQDNLPVGARDGEGGLPLPVAANLVLHTMPQSDHCARGARCDFHIVVSNDGAEAFEGRVILFDIASYENVGPVPAGAIIPDAPGVVCSDTGSKGRRCEMDSSPVHRLGPGEALEFRISIDVPASAPPGKDLTNCGFIDWGAMGIAFAGDSGNDWECVDVPLLMETGTVGVVDLEVTKGTAAGSCEPGAPCGFDLKIRNNGTVGYDGVLALDDVAAITGAGVLPEGAVRSLLPGLDCTAAVPGAGSRCTFAVPVSIAADGEWHTINMEADIPSDTEPGSELRNCVSIAWDAMGFPGGRDANPANDENICVVAPIAGGEEEPADFGPDAITQTEDMAQPDTTVEERNAADDRTVSGITLVEPAMPPTADLAISKTANEDNCTAGRVCRFSVTVTNNGPATFDGSILVSDRIEPPTAWLTGSSPSDWACRVTHGTYSCALASTSLAAGESRSLALVFTVGNSARGTLTNCAEVSRSVEGRIADMQQALNEAGFDAGSVDGIAGERTRAAVSAYQKANDLDVTGEADTALLHNLLGVSFPGDPVTENDSDCATVHLTAPPPAEEQPAQPQPQAQTPSEVGPSCPSGWQQINLVQAALANAQRRLVMPVTKSGKRILCAAPRQQQPATEGCPQDSEQVSRSQAKTLASQGYEIWQAGNLLCARKP